MLLCTPYFKKQYRRFENIDFYTSRCSFLDFVVCKTSFKWYATDDVGSPIFSCKGVSVGGWSYEKAYFLFSREPFGTSLELNYGDWTCSWGTATCTWMHACAWWHTASPTFSIPRIICTCVRLFTSVSCYVYAFCKCVNVYASVGYMCVCVFLIYCPVETVYPENVTGALRC